MAFIYTDNLEVLKLTAVMEVSRSSADKEATGGTERYS